jgi:hypothetical protein
MSFVAQTIFPTTPPTQRSLKLTTRSLLVFLIDFIHLLNWNSFASSFHSQFPSQLWHWWPIRDPFDLGVVGIPSPPARHWSAFNPSQPQTNTTKGESSLLQFFSIADSPGTERLATVCARHRSPVGIIPVTVTQRFPNDDGCSKSSLFVWYCDDNQTHWEILSPGVSPSRVPVEWTSAVFEFKSVNVPLSCRKRLSCCRRVALPWLLLRRPRRDRNFCYPSETGLWYHYEYRASEIGKWLKLTQPNVDSSPNVEQCGWIYPWISCRTCV